MAQNNGLNRRLDALEQLAEECRRREREQIIRELAAERGIPFERLLTLYHEQRDRTAELLALGWTDDRITEAAAERIGCTVDELRARADELMDRYG